MKPNFSVLGKRIARRGGHAKVTGAALYADDLVVPDLLYGVTLRSSIPCGRVAAIDLNP